MQNLSSAAVVIGALRVNDNHKSVVIMHISVPHSSYYANSVHNFFNILY